MQVLGVAAVLTTNRRHHARARLDVRRLAALASGDDG
jgi:hypothetical protein